MNILTGCAGYADQFSFGALLTYRTQMIQTQWKLSCICWIEIMTEDWTSLSFFCWFSSWLWPATRFSAKNTAKLQGHSSISAGVVTDIKRKKVKQKRKMRKHRDRNQVTNIRVGVRERSMVMVLRARGDLPKRDVGPTPGGDMSYLARGTRRDLRKGAVGLALATHGVVAKKVMVPALVSWKKTETSRILAPQGNLERHMNRDLNLRVGEGRVMVACHVD